jgi:hypothetical protein
MLMAFAGLLFLMPSQANAQAIANDSGGTLYLNPNDSDTGPSGFRRGAYVGPHELGEEVTNLLNSFEMKYTYYKPGGEGAYSTEERIVIKKPIYKAVKKLLDHYEKAYASGAMRQGEAATKATGLLQTGLKLLSFNTDTLEQQLKKAKKPADIEALFAKIKFQE